MNLTELAQDSGSSNELSGFKTRELVTSKVSSVNLCSVQSDQYLILYNITLPYMFQPNLAISKRPSNIIKGNYIVFLHNSESTNFA